MWTSITCIKELNIFYNPYGTWIESVIVYYLDQCFLMVRVAVDQSD